MSEWERGLRERQGRGRFEPKEILDVSTYGDDIEKPRDLCCEPDCSNVAEPSGRCTTHTEIEEVPGSE